MITESYSSPADFHNFTFIAIDISIIIFKRQISDLNFSFIMEKSDFNYQTFFFVRKEKSQKNENLTRSTQLNLMLAVILLYT